MDRPFEYLELGALETRLPRPTPLEFQTQNGSCRLYFNCIEIYATYFVLYTSTAQNIIEGLRRCQLPLLNAVRTFMVGTFSTSNIQRGAWTPIPILNSRRFSTQFHFSWLELYNIRILRTRIPLLPCCTEKGCPTYSNYGLQYSQLIVSQLYSNVFSLSWLAIPPISGYGGKPSSYCEFCV